MAGESSREGGKGGENLPLCSHASSETTKGTKQRSRWNTVVTLEAHWINRWPLSRDPDTQMQPLRQGGRGEGLVFCVAWILICADTSRSRARDGRNRTGAQAWKFTGRIWPSHAPNSKCYNSLNGPRVRTIVFSLSKCNKQISHSQGFWKAN